MKLPPHIQELGSVYVSTLTGRAIDKDKIGQICNDYWRNNPEPMADIPTEQGIAEPKEIRPVVLIKKRTRKKFIEEPVPEFKDDVLEQIATEIDINEDHFNFSEASHNVKPPTKRERKHTKEPLVDFDLIFDELDLVVGEGLARYKEYWPLIKSKVDIDTTGDDISKEKYLAMVAYFIHNHYPFDERYNFISKFCNRSIDVIKNHVAFGYKYYNWFLDKNADIGGTDYEIEYVIKGYFKKYYQLKDSSEF